MFGLLTANMREIFATLDFPKLPSATSQICDMIHILDQTPENLRDGIMEDKGEIFTWNGGFTGRVEGRRACLVL